MRRKRFPGRLPVVSLGAEHLTMGQLLRRNIQTWKAPQGQEGYDLVCAHPDPRRARKLLRIQVKSRYQSDCNGVVLVKKFEQFDYLIYVELNIGRFYSKGTGPTTPTFYVLPAQLVRRRVVRSKWGYKFESRRLNLTRYRDAAGFERIAQALRIPDPARRGGK